jgi:drug/metabolite transporter (DMT)-like permease
MMQSHLPQPAQRNLGKLYLWLAVAIFGAASSITRKIADLGTQHLVNGHNPVSLCNILFVGNLCALVILVALYRRDLNRQAMDSISRRQWPVLIIVAILAGALAPGLFFQALASTSVTNVVLIGRLEPPLTLVLSIWLLGERVNRWQLLGMIVAFIGVVLTIWLQPASVGMMGLRIGWGELFAALGAIASAVATLLTKKRLAQVPLSIFSVVRTGLGTLIFATLAIWLYGMMHFQELVSPFLWKWMLLYGSLVVVIGQSAWNIGMQTCSVATVGAISSFTPIFGIVAAFLILGEVPNPAQYLGGGVVLLGLYLSQLGMKRQFNQVDSVATELTASSKIGFKGT